MRQPGVKLDDIVAYRVASRLADYVWERIANWGWLAQRTIGVQFVSAADSNAANIAEGFGRYFKKDKIKFYYYARGSVFECSYWCKKAYQRKLLSVEDYEHILSELRKLPKEINVLIKLTSRLRI